MVSLSNHEVRIPTVALRQAQGDIPFDKACPEFIEGLSVTIFIVSFLKFPSGKRGAEGGVCSFPQFSPFKKGEISRLT